MKLKMQSVCLKSVKAVSGAEGFMELLGLPHRL